MNDMNEADDASWIGKIISKFAGVFMVLRDETEEMAARMSRRRGHVIYTLG